MTRFQLAIVGVGGQGVLAASQIVGEAAHASRIPVVVGQLHGMSQRGGSVVCTVILGAAESSFLSERDADAVVAFEPIEALRAAPQMGPATRVVTSRSLLVPSEVVLMGAAPPDVDDVLEELRGVAREVYDLDTRALMGGVAGARALNVLMLGAAVGLGLLPIPEAAVLDAVHARCGDKYREANGRAFLLGRDALSSRTPPRVEGRVSA